MCVQWIQHGFLMWPDHISYISYVLCSGSGHWTRTRLRAIIFKCIISRDKLIFMRDARFNSFNRKIQIYAISEKEQENSGRNRMRKIKNVIGRGRRRILSPWPGGVVDSGIRLSYRPASLCSLADRYDNSMPEPIIPQSGTKNLASRRRTSSF